MIIFFLIYVFLILSISIILQQRENINNVDKKSLIYHNEYKLFGHNIKLFITKDILINFAIYLIAYCVIIEPLLYLYVYKSNNTITCIEESISFKKLMSGKLSTKNYLITLLKFTGFQLISSLIPLIIYSVILLILYIFKTTM